jgi:hypothetical protein
MNKLGTLPPKTKEKLRQAGNFRVFGDLIEEEQFIEKVCEVGFRYIFGSKEPTRNEIGTFNFITPEEEFRKLAKAVEIATFAPDAEEYLEALARIAQSKVSFNNFVANVHGFAKGKPEYEQFRGIRIGSEYKGEKMNEEKIRKIARIIARKNPQKREEDLIKKLTINPNKELLDQETGIIVGREGGIDLVQKIGIISDAKIIVTENTGNFADEGEYIINPSQGRIEFLIAHRFATLVGFEDFGESEFEANITINALKAIRENGARQTKIEAYFASPEPENENGNEEYEETKLPRDIRKGMAKSTMPKIEEIEDQTQEVLGINASELIGTIKRWIEEN